MPYRKLSHPSEPRPDHNNLQLVWTTAADVGRVVPDLIQKTLTERDLPNTMRTMRKHIENTLEKLNP